MKSDSLWPWAYWGARGAVAFAKEEFDVTATYYERSYEAQPGFQILVGRARAYLELGRLGDAVQAFERALLTMDLSWDAIPPTTVKTHYWLGIAYERSGWNDKAATQYEIFLDKWKNVDPGIPEIDDAKARLARLTSSS